LRIPITPPREPELDLVVEDGNNPPLDLRSVVAEFAEMPWIYFEAPAGAVVARYDDRRASAPSYDLEAARASIRISDVPVATWGEPHETSVAAAPLLATPMPETGAQIDPAAFGFGVRCQGPRLLRSRSISDARAQPGTVITVCRRADRRRRRTACVSSSGEKSH
jgi:hypothetical protein